MKQGKYPPKITSNCLEVVSVPDHIKLSSYLEEALIARVLLFMKIFSLRSSLMPAVKDKCIVIPLEKNDVINNVESLPRLPSESGIIDIQWKRRLGQKNYHLQAKVDPTKLFEAIQFLKYCNNKYYVNTKNREEYEARCKEQDPDGYQLIFGAEPEVNSILKLQFVQDEASEAILDIKVYNELIKKKLLEQEYESEDTIRKFQIDYDESLCMVEKYPEAMQIEGVIDQTAQDQEANQLVVLAPGEGKSPVSLTYCDD